MNGFSETEYTVEKSVDIQTKQGVQILQVRVCPEPDAQELELREWVALKGIPTEPVTLRRYIAVSGCVDLLFFYSEGQEADLDSDWQRLVAEPEVSASELLWHQVVQHHSLGRKKDGSVILY